MHNSRILITEGMCQNTKNMKITPVTDICSKGDFVKRRVLTHPPARDSYQLSAYQQASAIASYLLYDAFTKGASSK